MNNEDFSNIFKEMEEEHDSSADKFWDSLTYDQKCDAFHAVVSRIVQGDMVERGSYRYVLYQIFGFEPDMYLRGMNCGYMDLHNSIMTRDDQNDLAEFRKNKGDSE